MKKIKVFGSARPDELQKDIDIWSTDGRIQIEDVKISVSAIDNPPYLG